VESVDDLAAVLRARAELGLSGGVVVANPIPEEHEIDPDMLDGWTQMALAEAAAAGVHGKDVTPFLLARLHTLSEGVTEEANKQLVYNNVRLAARIAAAL
jgi:pseudouridine-5'-phosphate glycosidase